MRDFVDDILEFIGQDPLSDAEFDEITETELEYTTDLYLEIYAILEAREASEETLLRLTNYFIARDVEVDDEEVARSNIFLGAEVGEDDLSVTNQSLVEGLSSVVAASKYALKSTRVDTTAPLEGGGDLSETRTLSIPKADEDTDGYLSKEDFAAFAADAGVGAITELTGEVSAEGPGSVAATINGKGTMTEDTSNVLTLTGWTNATFGSPTIRVKQAGIAQHGYLSSTDWNTFNSKVGGPVSSTDNRLVRWDGTTGQLVQDSAVQLLDSGSGGHMQLMTSNAEYRLTQGIWSGSIKSATLAAAREWTFPNKTGTVAMTSDLGLQSAYNVDPTMFYDHSLQNVLIGVQTGLIEAEFDQSVFNTLMFHGDSVSNYLPGSILRASTILSMIDVSNDPTDVSYAHSAYSVYHGDNTLSNLGFANLASYDGRSWVFAEANTSVYEMATFQAQFYADISSATCNVNRYVSFKAMQAEWANGDVSVDSYIGYEFMDPEPSGTLGQCFGFYINEASTASFFAAGFITDTGRLYFGGNPSSPETSGAWIVGSKSYNTLAYHADQHTFESDGGSYAFFYGNACQFYIPIEMQYSSSGYARVGGVIETNTTAVGNVGTGEDNLMQFTFPAGGMGTNKQGVIIEAWGTFAANANNKNVKLYFGATALVASGAVGINGGSWWARAIVLRTGATKQEAIAELRYTNAAGTTTTIVSRTTPGATLSGNVTIKCTGEATSNDDISQKGMTIHYQKEDV